MPRNVTEMRIVALAVLVEAGTAQAASGGGDDWLPWLVVGAIGVFVAGIVLRTIVAARFPKGYRRWAERRREAFAANNDAWDREDEEFRR